jgi:hypothetical protein
MLRKAVILGAAILLLASPAALAAFPGRDGELAVQPLSGGGIELVHADGTGSRLICTARPLCGRPIQPRFSPTGRAIVFEDARSTHIGIVAPDGTCLWCLLGRPLTQGFGYDPAFASATAVTFTQETATSLSRASLTGGGTQRIAGAPAAAAVTSSRGELAAVKGRWIELRAPRAHRFTRLTVGAGPVWSPRGTYLAFTRRGWIWIIRAHRSARPRRLTRGASPAWSPRGGRIAYIASGGAVSVMTTSGGHRRRVGSVRGRSVDWQPLPRGPAPCADGNGAIVSQTTTTLLRQTLSGTDADGRVGWNGCLRAVGVPRHLGGGPSFGGCYYSLTLAGARVAGRFAALNVATCDHEAECNPSIVGGLADLGGGPPVTLGVAGCTAGLSPTEVDTSGFTAWLQTTSYLGFAALGSVACASRELCVATSGWGLVTSTNPTAADPSWQPVFLGTLVAGDVSCPSASFCLAVYGDEALTSADPSGGPTAWRHTRLPNAGRAPGFLSSCPSAALCVVGGGAGRLWVSADPTGGTSTWRQITLKTPVPPGSQSENLSGVACPSTSLCVAIDPSGDVFTSTDPAGGSATWSKTATLPIHLLQIACPSASLCVALGGDGEIASSTDPTGAAAAWNIANSGAGVESLACGSPALCVADGPSQLLTSTDGASTWTSTPAPVGSLFITCTGDDLCAIPAGARMFVSATPTAGGPSYTGTLADNGPCGTTATVCIGQQLFVDDDGGKRVAAQSLPGPTAPLSAPTLFGNSLTATWSDDGIPQSATLR